MCSVTIGGREAAYSERGAYGSLAEVLHPIHRGILGFVGFTVVEPFAVFAPKRKTNDERAAELRRFSARVLTMDEAPCIVQPENRRPRSRPRAPALMKFRRSSSLISAVETLAFFGFREDMTVRG